MALTRERIKTDNEKYGSGFLLGDEGGAWIVSGPDGVSLCVCSNRAAAEAALYDKAREAREAGLPAVGFSISVWHIHDTWPASGVA